MFFCNGLCLNNTSFKKTLTCNVRHTKYLVLAKIFFVMYPAWESLWGQSKYSLRNTKEKGVVGNLCTVYLGKYFKHIGHLGDINERTVHCLVYLTAPESAVHVNPLIISSQIEFIVRRWSLQQGAAATENAMSHVTCCSCNICTKRCELLICTQSPLPMITKYSTF